MFCALMLLVLASAQRATAQDEFMFSLLACDSETGEITNDRAFTFYGVCGKCLVFYPQVLLFSCEDPNKVTVHDSESGCQGGAPGLEVDLSSRKCHTLGTDFAVRRIEVARAGGVVPTTTTTVKRALEDAPSVPTATSGAATSSARALQAAAALSAAAAVRAALRL